MKRRREWIAQPGKQKLFAVLDWKGKTVRVKGRSLQDRV
jgi:hypothetical protein